MVTKNGGKYLGFDNSQELIKIAKLKYGNDYFFIADILSITQNLNVKCPACNCLSTKRLAGRQNHNLNLKANISNSCLLTPDFDVIYCLAVLHHIPSHELRLQALKNLKSLLKPNSLLILSVWNLWQKKYLKYIIKEWLLKLIGKSGLDWGNCYIPYQAQKSKIKNQNQSLELKTDTDCHSKFPRHAEFISASSPFSIKRYLHAFTLNELINLVNQTGFQILEKRKTKGNLLIIAKLKIDL